VSQDPDDDMFLAAAIAALAPRQFLDRHVRD
jgi:hypothetical protein